MSPAGDLRTKPFLDRLAELIAAAVVAQLGANDVGNRMTADSAVERSIKMPRGAEAGTGSPAT